MAVSAAVAKAEVEAAQVCLAGRDDWLVLNCGVTVKCRTLRQSPPRGLPVDGLLCGRRGAWCTLPSCAISQPLPSPRLQTAPAPACSHLSDPQAIY